MTLLEMLSVLHFDETIHIRNSDDSTVFFGKAGNAHSEVEEDVLRRKRVHDVFTGFSGICIDVADD